MNLQTIRQLQLFLVLLFIFILKVNGQTLKLHESYSNDHFVLTDSTLSSSIYIDSSDFKVVKIAANDLAEDIERVLIKNRR